MSTLYLHCGYHKTGSSFLQTMFSNNRSILNNKGIYYPYSDMEYEMQSGINTYGNGKVLADALKKLDIDTATHTIEKDLKTAQTEGARSLLYSTEVFFHFFAKEGALQTLQHASAAAGITRIEALIYFRDPVSHALSTYKHRAKSGDHADFKDWITNRYETMGLLDSFCSYRSKYDIVWSCRKYRSGSGFMTRSAFVEWLGTEMPEIPEYDRVNSSLMLSEIVLLQGVKGAYDFCT